MRAEVGVRLRWEEGCRTEEVVGRDAVIVPDLQDQHCRLPEFSLLQGEGPRPAPDAHLPLRGQVVKAEHEAPVEVPLPSQRVEVHICLLPVMLQPLHPAGAQGRGRLRGASAGPNPEPSFPVGSPIRPVLPPSSRHLRGLRGQGSGSAPGPKPQFATSPLYSATCAVQLAGLPFYIDVTRHLSSERVHIVQNHILCVPDDDSELITGGSAWGAGSDS